MRTLAPAITATLLHGSLALLGASTAGCGPKEQALDEAPDGDDDDDDDVDAGCVEDSECSFGTICDLDEASDTFGDCIDGDRSNSPEEAVPVPLTTDLDAIERVNAVISPPGDVDYFVYTSTGEEWVSVRTETDGGREVLDTYVTITDPSGSVHASLDNYPTGLVSAPLDTVLYTYLPDPGDYIIAVEDITTASVYAEFFTEEDWRGGAASTYSVYVRSAGAAVEPDSPDDPSTTIVISDGGTITALGILLEEPGDVDHIDLEMEVAGEPLEVWVQPDRPGSIADAQLDLFDPDGVWVASKRAGAGDDGYLSYFDPEAATYRLEASDAGGNSGADAWYVVYVRSYEPDGLHPFFGSSTYAYESEPNDESAEALDATVEETSDGESYDSYRLEGRVDLVGDIDRFSVDVPNGDFLSVRCFTDRFGSLLVPTVSLWQDDFDRTPKGQGETPTDTDYYVANADVTGVVQVHLEGAAGGDVGAGAYYRCVAFVTPFEVEAGER